MKILFIVPRLHTNLYYRVLALRNQGHVVAVVALYRGVSELKMQGVQYLGFSLLSRMFSFSRKVIGKTYLKSNMELNLLSPSLIGLIFYMRKFKPDAVIVKGNLNLLVFKSIVASLFVGSKTYLFSQTRKNTLLSSSYLLKAYHYFLRLLGVDGVMTPIRRTKEVFDSVGFLPVHYLPFVFPAKKISKEINSEIQILSVGKFVKRKAQRLLIEAFIRAGVGRDAHLTLIGERVDEVYIKEIMGYIKSQGISDSVTLKFNLSHSQVLEHYGVRDIFVLPSYGEPAAYSVVEAMAYGLPVIMSSDSGTNCYIDNGINGYVFKSKDLDSLTKALSAIIVDNELLANMSAQSYTYAKEVHSLENFSSKMDEILV